MCGVVNTMTNGPYVVMRSVVTVPALFVYICETGISVVLGVCVKSHGGLFLATPVMRGLRKANNLTYI